MIGIEPCWIPDPQGEFEDKLMSFLLLSFTELVVGAER